MSTDIGAHEYLVGDGVSDARVCNSLDSRNYVSHLRWTRVIKVRLITGCFRVITVEVDVCVCVYM